MLKDILLIGQKKFQGLMYVINDLNGEENVGTFYEKELQKTNQKRIWNRRSD